MVLSRVEVNVLSPLKVLTVIVLFSLIALVLPSVQFIHQDQAPLVMGVDGVRVVRELFNAFFLVA